MYNIILCLITLAIPLLYYTSRYKDRAKERYLKDFNKQYHIDNASQEHAKKLIEMGSSPFHAVTEKDIEEGIAKDMEYTCKREDFLDSLSLDEHMELISSLDGYMQGDISDVKKAKGIAKERGYKIPI